VLVRRVFDGTTMTIRFDQRVFTLDLVAVTGFLLVFHITGVFIMDGVREFVLGWAVVFLMVAAIGVVVGGTNSFQQNWSSLDLMRLMVVVVHSNGARTDGGDQSEKCDKLKRVKKLKV
jgi:hypothetical protein